jgi:hypothetical protein
MGLNCMKLFYAIVLPVIWVVAAVVSYSHPGDEYGLFVFSSIAGSWVCFFIRNIGHLSDVLWLIIVAGVTVVANFGLLMDRLQVSRRVWGTLFVLCFVLVLVLSLRQYPSLDRAISKNGSITAYVAGAWNMGLYLSILSSLIVRGVAIGACRKGPGRTAEPGAGGDA